ncbi:auxin response factor 14 [Medicago truncatula]|uniref:Auxin response factor 14 n=1 Tax=Medicago truncatula TaxID=3880 RepID=G7KFL5_MEDTR|nr:auxin response factor 14 [Medicago truncatula]
MRLQQEQKEAYLPAELGTPSKQPTNYFCKTLTASQVTQALTGDCLCLVGRLKKCFLLRHLLTTGWSVFVSAKILVAGDSVMFTWNEKNQLLFGIRHAIWPQTVMPSSVLSTDSLHLGLLAAVAHAAATNSPFTIFYNPRACPSEFVIPSLSIMLEYVKVVYHA